MRSPSLSSRNEVDGMVLEVVVFEVECEVVDEVVGFTDNLDGVVLVRGFFVLEERVFEVVGD